MGLRDKNGRKAQSQLIGQAGVSGRSIEIGFVGLSANVPVDVDEVLAETEVTKEIQNVATEK